MTVAELIAELQRYEQTEMVCVRWIRPGYSGSRLFKVAGVDGDPDVRGGLVAVPLLELGEELQPLGGTTLPRSRKGVPSLDDVLAHVSYDEARTVQQIADLTVGPGMWHQRTTVRNRLNDLERRGLVISDGNKHADGRTSRWIRPDR